MAKVWSFSFSISPSNEHPGLISFRMDWLDLLAVQGTLKSLLQHHSSKASVLRPSAFFTVQLSHPYMTTGKTIALTRWTCAGKVMSLLFNMLSGLVTALLPRRLIHSRCHLVHHKVWEKIPNPSSSLHERLNHALLCAAPGTVAHQAPLSMKWAAISSSCGSSQPKDPTRVCCGSYTGRHILYH